MDNTPSHTLSHSHTSQPDPTNTDLSALDALTPTEQQVLDEYARLLGNLNNLNALLAELSENPSAEILDSLRGLERKTSLVFTLLKASVYSIVLQQQIGVDEEQEGGGGGMVGSFGGSVG
jgi:DASH complex subunit DAD3